MTEWFQTLSGTSKASDSRRSQETAKQQVRGSKICTSNAKSHAVKLRVQSGPRSLQHEMTIQSEVCVHSDAKNGHTLTATNGTDGIDTRVNS